MNILTKTADGSNTLYNETIGEHYHSSHGALQESKHVFIDAGLKYAIEKNPNQVIKILEVGFGTGLNFLMSYSYAEEQNIILDYTGIEAFPLAINTIKETGYQEYVAENIWKYFIDNYEESLKQKTLISPNYELIIVPKTLNEFSVATKFDLLYYDAFSVRHQPEMWTNEIIAHACSFLKPSGIFVSYAITGNLKRAVKACGFTIEKLPGAAGKREMLRATKSA